MASLGTVAEKAIEAATFVIEGVVYAMGAPSVAAVVGFDESIMKRFGSPTLNIQWKPLP